jgi:cellulose synthase/poly-beta-1,6-N-acetylglucosamine synthase-like glycosyltransferase
LIAVKEIGVIVLTSLWWAIALIVCVPILTFVIECALALLPGRSPGSLAGDMRVAVLIPAHNEALGIRETLGALQPQLTAGDRVIVVADNCTDDTAAIARAAGAMVLERHNLEQRGKGYALDAGLRSLDDDPPDIVVMVDADCTVLPGALQTIAHQAAKTRRPVQALYLMEQPPNPSPKDSVSALAFMVKNWVRPRGLQRLGFPCLLTGTGMAFPWAMIRQSPLASGNIVEDMQLGLDLALAGAPPQFCESARVLGRLPQQDQAATSQRTRWEHGHLQTLVTQVPRLVTRSLVRGRVGLLALALDLAVPPLSLLVMLWVVAMLGAIAVGALTGTWAIAMVLAAQGGLLLVAVLAAWARFGRSIISLQRLLSIPLYVLWKIPMYAAVLVRPQQQWVRTERDPVPPKVDGKTG